MLNGPRTCPNTFSTLSTTPWYSAATSDLPVMGATRGMMTRSFREVSCVSAHAIVPQSLRECTAIHKTHVGALDHSTSSRTIGHRFRLCIEPDYSPNEG